MPQSVNREQALAVLCDLAFTIAGEVSSEALLVKTLQRFLYHTGYSAGFFLTREAGETDGLVSGLLEVAIGDYRLIRHRGERITVPAALLPAAPGPIPSADVLAALDTSVPMLGGLSLPVEGYGHMVLMSPRPPEQRLNLADMFKPVLSRLATAVTLCREYERRHESTRRILLRAIEDSPIGILVTDVAGHIEYVNACMCTNTGYSREELIGQNPRLLKGGDKSREEYQALWSTIKSGEAWRGEFHNRRKDGSLYWEKATIAPVRDPDGAITHFVAIKEDVTEKKARDDELRRMVSYLSEANAELERFAFIASHDLREPLRTIAAFAQLLEKRYGGKLGDDADAIIKLMVGGAKRMDALINDLLVYSQMSASTAPAATVALSRACAAAMDHLGRTIRASGAEIVVEHLPRVHGDAEQLTQVFENLLDNAIKFRRPEVAPRIRIWAEQDGDKRWTVSVADNGIGIEASQQDIFEIFRRLHTIDQYPGTGVGLAICKRVIRRLGGRIWFEAAPGGGSIFRFTLNGAEEDGAEA
jgi:PAS domain S-box-containing protein